MRSIDGQVIRDEATIDYAEEEQPMRVAVAIQPPVVLNAGEGTDQYTAIIKNAESSVEIVCDLDTHEVDKIKWTKVSGVIINMNKYLFI